MWDASLALTFLAKATNAIDSFRQGKNRLLLNPLGLSTSLALSRCERDQGFRSGCSVSVEITPIMGSSDTLTPNR